MSINKIIICALICFLFLGMAGNAEDSYSPSRTEGLIRVGISTNKFRKLEYKEVSLSSDGKLSLYDDYLGREIMKSESGDVLKFEMSETSINLYKNEEKFSHCIIGPIIVHPLDEKPIKVVGLTRKGKQAAYRGDFEIVRAPGKKGLLSLVNVIPLEEYLKGVVPNELPPYFGTEALKAQTIAARNYAIRPRIKRYAQFDLCDSVQSQVYFGYNTEAPESNQAINDTKGLVALHDGEVIIALYSSAAGGYTENYENAFSAQGGGSFPADPLPYLKGKPDKQGTPVLNTDEAARKFYTTRPFSFDQKSKYFRWNRTWTGDELRKSLNIGLNKYRNSDLISPSPKKGIDVYYVKDVKILKRGVSGKAVAIKVETAAGTWVIKKELLIRRIFTKNGKALPSANMVLNCYRDKNGYIYKMVAYGGGFGHGVGMSQYGASYMSNNGYSFDQILQHYYSGISIGTWPAYLTSEYATTPVKQEFASPAGEADLVIENFEELKHFEFKINSKTISLDNTHLCHEKIRIPLNKYIKKGENQIIFYPLDETEEKSIKAWIEVYRKKN